MLHKLGRICNERKCCSAEQVNKNTGVRAQLHGLQPCIGDRFRDLILLLQRQLFPSIDFYWCKRDLLPHVLLLGISGVPDGLVKALLEQLSLA